jgi:Tfp pilus assembly protein PilF
MDRIEKLLAFISKNPADSFLQHALALEYMKLDRDDEARNLFEDILSREPGYVGSYYHLGKLLEKNNDTEAAISWYEKGMEVAKKAGEMQAYGELKGAYESLTM